MNLKDCFSKNVVFLDILLPIVVLLTQKQRVVITDNRDLKVAEDSEWTIVSGRPKNKFRHPSPPQ